MGMHGSGLSALSQLGRMYSMFRNECYPPSLRYWPIVSRRVLRWSLRLADHAAAGTVCYPRALYRPPLSSCRRHGAIQSSLCARRGSMPAFPHGCLSIEDTFKVGRELPPFLWVGPHAGMHASRMYHAIGMHRVLCMYYTIVYIYSSMSCRHAIRCLASRGCRARVLFCCF